jgi:hypothetical protein
VLGIDADVVLVAEEALAVLLRPAGIDVLLLALGLAPVRGDLPRFYLRVLLAAAALDGDLHNARIDNLPGLRLKPRPGKEVAKAVERDLGQLQLPQPLAKAPHRGGIGDVILDAQTEDAQTEKPENESRPRIWYSTCPSARLLGDWRISTSNIRTTSNGCRPALDLRAFFRVLLNSARNASQGMVPLSAYGKPPRALKRRKRSSRSKKLR